MAPDPSGSPPAVAARILAAVDAAAPEIVDFTRELIRIPTVNPPGEFYEDCARLVGDRLARFGHEVEYLVPDDRPEHTAAHPRVNVLGTLRGARPSPRIHLNGHLDVVPVGEGWTVDPFEGVVRDGRIFGRGAADMKGGLAAAVFAVEAIRRAGIRLAGTVEISGTVDEESGGFAGMGHLARIGRVKAGVTDAVIIPEPLNVDRICIGHRGVYWFEVTTQGHIAHGSMPFLGRSAIDQMGAVLEAVRRELLPTFAARRTAVPVVPDDARHATLNINAIHGGQPLGDLQSPSVADRCTAVFDRRFLLEEGFEATRREMVELLERLEAEVPGFRYELRDRMVVEPTRTPEGAPVVSALGRAIAQVLGREATLVASPGTYDHKHVTRIGGVENCVAYGPGVLEQSHQPDEWCAVEDLVNATKVLALAVAELAGVESVQDGS